MLNWGPRPTAPLSDRLRPLRAVAVGSRPGSSCPLQSPSAWSCWSSWPAWHFRASFNPEAQCGEPSRRCRTRAAPSTLTSPAPEPEPTSAPEPSPSPEPTQATELPSVQDVDELLSHIPESIAATCTEQTYPDEFGVGLVTAVSCLPTGSPGPDTIAYLQYESSADMQAIYGHITDTIAPGLPKGPGCGSDGGRGSWSRNRVPAGTYACYDTVSSGVWMWWTVDELAIITLATDQEMSVTQIWGWFVETNTGPS